jgi:hypothetical protein
MSATPESVPAANAAIMAATAALLLVGMDVLHKTNASKKRSMIPNPKHYNQLTLVLDTERQY